MRCWPTPVSTERARGLLKVLPARRGAKLVLPPAKYRGDGLNRLPQGVEKL